MATQIKLRRDTAANWTSANPVLAQGEPGYDLTSKKLKIGDGITSWNSLAYFDDKETVLSNYAGHIVPSADNTYDLGSPTRQWRDIFVSNGSVYIGDIKLSNDTGTLKAVQVTDPGLVSEQEVSVAFPSINTAGTGSGANIWGSLIPTGLGENVFQLYPGDSVYSTPLVTTIDSVSVPAPGDLVIGLGGGSGTNATVPHVPNLFIPQLNHTNKLEYITDTVTEGGRIFLLSVADGSVSYSSSGPEDYPEVISVDVINGTVTFDRPLTWSGNFGVYLGRNATATALVSNDLVVGITITDPGWGYGNGWCNTTSGIIVQESVLLNGEGENIGSKQYQYKTDLQLTRMAGFTVFDGGENYKNPKVRIQAQDLPAPGSGINTAENGNPISARFNIDPLNNNTITNVTLDGPSPFLSMLFNGTVQPWFGTDEPQYTLIVEDGEVTQSPAIAFDNGVVFTGRFDELVDTPTIPTDISDLTDTQGLLGGGSGNTGSITFEANNIIGSGADSGDGNGFNTIRLVPDDSLFENDQYLIVDPTSPGHIHIRAGGSQDNSNADLMLGGEKNYVRVNDFNGVRLQNERVAENFYYYTDPSFTVGSWYEENGNFYIEFTTIDQTMINKFWEFSNNDQNRIVVNQNDTLTFAGWSGNLGNDVYKVQVTTGPATSPQVVTTIEFQIFTTQTNELYLENGDFRLEVYDDIRMFGRDIFRLANYSVEEPIEITTDYDNNSYTWSFNPTGSLRLPGGAEINSTNNNIELTVGTSIYTFLYDQMVGSSLQIPGSIQGSTQTSFLSSNGLGISIDGFNSPNTVDIGNIPSSTVLRLKDGDGAGNIVVQSLGTSLKLQTNNNSTWEFNDNSGLTFPDNTVQTTAYQGNILTTVAKTGSGAPATGEVATITLSPTNNTNFVPGTYPGIFLAIGAGFSFTLVVAENGDLSATIISSNGGFTVGDSGSLNGAAIAGGSTGTDDITVTVASLTNIAYPTELDLTKQVQKLADGWYTLNDGVEGQIMHLVASSSLTDANSVTVVVANARIGTNVGTDYWLYPFNALNQGVHGFSTVIFVDGAWQANGGQWD